MLKANASFYQMLNDANVSRPSLLEPPLWTSSFSHGCTHFLVRVEITVDSPLSFSNVVTRCCSNIDHVHIAMQVKTIKLDCRLLSATTAATATAAAAAGRGTAIESIKLYCEPNLITATVFIDASYDGEVMVAAGDVAYTAGREANTTYNESLAGARAPGWVGVGGARHVPALRSDGAILKYVTPLSHPPFLPRSCSRTLLGC